MTNSRQFIPWKNRPELCDRLRELWADSTITTMQIAATLGFPFQKNAIIGKAHRLGLPLRANPALTGEAHPRWTGGRKIRDQRYRAKRKLNPIELEPPQEDVMTDHSNGVSFIDHTFDQCKWPLTEGPRTIGMGCIPVLRQTSQGYEMPVLQRASKDISRARHGERCNAIRVGSVSKRGTYLGGNTVVRPPNASARARYLNHRMHKHLEKAKQDKERFLSLFALDACDTSDAKYKAATGGPAPAAARSEMSEGEQPTRLMGGK